MILTPDACLCIRPAMTKITQRHSQRQISQAAGSQAAIRPPLLSHYNKATLVPTCTAIGPTRQGFKAEMDLLSASLKGVVVCSDFASGYRDLVPCPCSRELLQQTRQVIRLDGKIMNSIHKAEFMIARARPA